VTDFVPAYRAEGVDLNSFETGIEKSRIRYHDIQGSGSPLIFIHGLGCASSSDYPRIASNPALLGRRMLLVDLLGSGFSDRPAGFGYTVEDHARTVAALAQHLSFGSLDLWGTAWAALWRLSLPGCFAIVCSISCSANQTSTPVAALEVVGLRR
jgi:pimeloyl-ACP methyl ester carboxylesterase